MTHFDKQKDQEFYAKLSGELFKDGAVSSIMIDGQEAITPCLLESFLVLCVHVFRTGMDANGGGVQITYPLKESPALLADVWMRARSNFQDAATQLDELWCRWLEHRTREKAGDGWVTWDPAFQPACRVKEEEDAKDILQRMWELTLLADAVHIGLVEGRPEIREDEERIRTDLAYFQKDFSIDGQRLWKEQVRSYLDVIDRYQQTHWLTVPSEWHQTMTKLKGCEKGGS